MELLRGLWGRSDKQPECLYDHADSLPALLQQQRTILYPYAAPIRARTTPTERVLLAGPLKSWPGSWVSLILLVPSFEEQDRIVGFTGDAVDGKEQPVPFPPLHMHHIHVASGEYTHLWETHGDYEMRSTRDASGHPTVGYTSRVRSPYCRRLGGTKLSVNAQINDVRGDAAGSGMAQSRGAGHGSVVHAVGNNHTGAAVTWWLRIRFELSLAPCRPASKLLLWYPCERWFCRRDFLRRFDVGSSPHGRVSWWETTAPVGGELLDAWLHTHRARYAGFLLVRGHLETPWIERLAAVAHARRSSPGGDLARLRAMLLDSLRQRNAILCHDDPAVTAFERRIEVDGPRYYDRQGRLECPTAPPLIAGEPLTCLSFSANVWDTHLDPYPQHVMFFANVANATAAAVPMYQGWARTYSYLTLEPSNHTLAKAQSVALDDAPLRVDEGEESGRDRVNALNRLVRPRWPPPPSS